MSSFRPPSTSTAPPTRAPPSAPGTSTTAPPAPKGPPPPAPSGPAPKVTPASPGSASSATSSTAKASPSSPAQSPPAKSPPIVPSSPQTNGAKPVVKTGPASPTKDAPPPPAPDGEPEESSEEDDDDSEDAEEDEDAPAPPDEVQEDASEIVKKLQHPSTLTLKDALHLKSLLSVPGRTFKNDFVQSDGLDAFAALLGKSSQLPRAGMDDIKMEILSCIEAFLGSAEPSAWLTPMLYSETLIPNICSEVGSRNSRLKLKAIQLLTVVCWINPDGRRSVFTALDVPSKDFHGLQVIINDLQHLDVKNAENIANTMILVNSLINSASELEERLDARKRMRALGLFQVIEKLSDMVDAAANEERYNELHAQLDEYDTALLRDQRETLRDGIDLTDPDAVYSYLKKSVSEDGFGGQFLNILQAMMTVPSDKEQGEKIWNNLSHIVAMAVMKDGSGGDRRAVPFEKLKEALRKKEEESDKEAESRYTQLEQKAESLRSELHQMKMKARYADELKEKLVAAQAQLVALKESKGKSGPSHPAPSAPSAGGAGGASSKEVEALRQQLAERDEKIRDLEAKLGSGGGGPPLDGGAPDAPPLDDGAPDAPPLDDAPPPPPMDDGEGGPPPPPPMDGDGPPDAPPMDGDGPPPAPDMGAGPAKSSLPKKKVIKPKEKMKKFHWQKIEDRQVKESVWFTLNDEEIKFDTAEFEAQFCQKDAPAKDETEVKEKEKKKKAEVVKLVDEKRSYNTDITLARFRMTNSHIRDAILSVDETTLDQDKLVQLIKIAPTPEEIEAIQAYTGDVNALGNTEKFFRCISSIPRIQRRLEFMLFKQQFKGIYTGFKSNVDSVSTALTQVKNSVNLKKVLTIALAFGNYMNGGTPKGQAWGFKLSALNRLNSSKSVDNQTSLLHYIAEYVKKTCPPIRGFMEDIVAVHDACRVESLFLQGEVGKVVGIVQRIDVELQRSEENIIDRFVPVMREFYNKANKKITKISSRLDKTFEDYNALLKWFAVGAEEKMQWEDFFSIFDKFVKAYQLAEQQLDEIKERKAKQAKLDAQKAQQEKEKAEKKLKKEAGGGDEASAGGGGEKKKKKKKKKALVDRVMTSLRKRRDSEFIRMQMLGQVDKPKKMKKRRKKPAQGEEGTEQAPGSRRERGQSVKGIFGSRKKTTVDGQPKKKTGKGSSSSKKGTGKSEADLVASIQSKMATS